MTQLTHKWSLTRMALLMLVGTLAVLLSGSGTPAQEKKEAAPEKQEKFKLRTVKRIGYTRPGSPEDRIGKKGEVLPLAWDITHKGQLIGGTVYFVVLERTGTDDNDPWGIGIKDFMASFKEGKSTRGSFSPKLDNKAKYLYLYQLVNDRGLDPATENIVRPAIEMDFANVLPVASVKVDLRVDPRYITSWGHFQSHGFVATVPDRERTGKIRPAAGGKGAKDITLAVSSNPSILGELPKRRYAPRCEAFDLGELRDTFGLLSSTYNLQNSLEMENLKKKPEAKLVSWEKNMLQATTAARQPDYVQIDYAGFDERLIPAAGLAEEEPVQAWFHATWQKNDKRDNLVYLGHHSPVFGFTSDLEPRDENVLIEDPANANRLVDIQPVANILAAAAGANAEGVAVGQGVGGVVSPRAPAVSTPVAGGFGAGLLGGGMAGGISGVPGIAGGVGAIGVARPGTFGGGLTGTTNGSGTTTQAQAQTPSQTINFTATLTNQQQQQQQQQQFQNQNNGNNCHCDGQVIPEPRAFLLALLGLPVLFFMRRRSQAVPA